LVLLLLHQVVADVSSAPRIYRVLKTSRPGAFLDETPDSDERPEKSRSMSKRSSDGDVLSNRLSLGFAKNQKLLASWVGAHTEPEPVKDKSQIEEEDNELKQNHYGHDRYLFLREDVGEVLTFVQAWRWRNLTQGIRKREFHEAWPGAVNREEKSKGTSRI
jgi:hypothetical protein